MTPEDILRFDRLVPRYTTERPAAADEAHWRETRDGGRTALAIAEVGLQAISMEVDRKTSKQSSSTKAQPKQRSRRAERKPSGSKPKGKTSPGVAVSDQIGLKRVGSARSLDG